MGGVFINYRVAEENMGAAVIHDTLSWKFGRENVFRDRNSLQAGENYPQALRDGLARSDILLVVIGPQWITLRGKDDSGKQDSGDHDSGRDNSTDDGSDDGSPDGEDVRLIDRRRDWVRWEIEEALRRGLTVIPVLLKTGDRDPLMPTKQMLPPSIRELALFEASRVDQANLGPDLEKLAIRLVGIAPELVIPRLFTPPPPPRTPDSAPSTLLRPEYEVVPFTGQTGELADLRSWATGPAACSARLLIGPGGSGKTRLARALCEDLITANWLAGIVHGQAPATEIRHTAGIDKPLLVVVDDVETRTDQLVALATAIGERSVLRDAPARLLLLGRSKGDWLHPLTTHADQRVRDLFRPVAPHALTLTAPDRHQQFDTATRAFATALGRPPRTAALPAGTTGMLAIHATALATALGGEDTGQPVDPLRRLLRLDRAHFRRLARADRSAHLDPTTLAAVGTLATLCRPASSEQADSLMARLPMMIGPVEDYVAWWDRLYPGPCPLSPLKPDVLGEQLVATTVLDRPGLATAVATHGTNQQITHALTVLGRSLHAYPPLCDVVRTMIRTDPERLAPIGLVVAAGLPDHKPFARVVGSVIQDSGISLNGIWSLMDTLGRESGRSADPVRVDTLDAFVKPFTSFMNRAVPTDGVPAPLRNVADGLTALALGIGKQILDPGADAMPKRPDGTDMIPREIMELIRTLIEGPPNDGRR